MAGGHDVREHDEGLLVDALGRVEERRVRERDAHVFGLGAVGGVAEDPAGLAAVREEAALAVVAVAAVADAGYQHCVADLVAHDARADAVDRTDAFVLCLKWLAGDVRARILDTHPDGDALLAGWDMALEDVQVGAADSGVFDLDDGVGGLLYFRFGLVL